MSVVDRGSTTQIEKPQAVENLAVDLPVQTGAKTLVTDKGWKILAEREGFKPAKFPRTFGPTNRIPIAHFDTEQEATYIKELIGLTRERSLRDLRGVAAL